MDWLFCLAVTNLVIDGSSSLELPLDVKRSKAPLLANSAGGGLLLLVVKSL
uniref:Uncharacterized protein n=1 Tax=Arundo donax TaxID=35708 RepID=A0A0A9G2F0_ARUDO